MNIDEANSKEISTGCVTGKTTTHVDIFSTGF